MNLHPEPTPAWAAFWVLVILVSLLAQSETWHLSPTPRGVCMIASIVGIWGHGRCMDQWDRDRKARQALEREFEREFEGIFRRHSGMR